MKGLCSLACAALTAMLIVSTGTLPAAQERASADRDREAMHPGDPLRIVGVSEGDNDILEGAPTLSRSEFLPVQVDTDDLRARQLMLLNGGASFDRPPRPAALTSPERERALIRATHLRAPGAKEVPDGESEGSRSWLSIALAAAAAAAVFVSRGRWMP